jgi:hypothetical protein
MLYVEDIEKIILLDVLANKTTLDKPISLMLIAKSEAGGSELLREFNQISTIYSTSDLTYVSLVIDLLDKIFSGKITIIMISDYNKIVSKKTSTAINIETALCDLMEEGITDIRQIGKMSKHYPKAVKCAIIAKMTKDMYNQSRARWLETGFNQRFIFIFWNYEDSQQKEIKAYLQNDLKIEKVKFILPKLNGVKLNFVQPLGIYSKLDEIVNKLYDKHYGYGFRLTIALKELCKANCLLRYIISNNFNGKIPKKIDLTVEQQDIDEIIRLSVYMNSNDIKTPKSNSPDIQFLEKKTQLTEMQKERIKESLEKQEITLLTKEEIGVKQQEIEQTQKIESYSEELKLYIKNNNFEKLDNNTLSNKIYNEEKLEVELKKKFLIELKHESWLSFIQEINKIKGSNSK